MEFEIQELEATSHPQQALVSVLEIQRTALASVWQTPTNCSLKV